MGYYIFSYGIDFKEVQNSFNSKDQSLFDKILESEVFDTYASQDFDGCITTKEALQNIILGEPYKDNNAHVYGYAFISICAYLGKSVPAGQEIKLGYETDLINKYLSTDFGVETEIENILFEDTPALGLPKIEDWPLSGIMRRQELTALQTRLSPIEITDEQIEDLWDGEEEEDEDKACAYEHIKGIKENIAFCLENNLSFISFCH
ncbi:MAG: hypothetical protein ACK5KL_18750 [Dysgonomonas sp.]